MKPRIHCVSSVLNSDVLRSPFLYFFYGDLEVVTSRGMMTDGSRCNENVLIKKLVVKKSICNNTQMFVVIPFVHLFI